MKPDAIALLKAAVEFLDADNLYRLTIVGGRRVTKSELATLIRNELADQNSYADLRSAGGVTHDV